MFKRIILEEWTVWVPILSFAMTASVFIFITVRSLRLKKSKVAELANLPLSDD